MITDYCSIMSFGTVWSFCGGSGRCRWEGRNRGLRKDSSAQRHQMGNTNSICLLRQGPKFGTPTEQGPCTWTQRFGSCRRWRDLVAHWPWRLTGSDFTFNFLIEFRPASFFLILPQTPPCLQTHIFCFLDTQQRNRSKNTVTTAYATGQPQICQDDGRRKR